MNLVAFTISAIFALLVVVQADPTTPVWPNQFTQNFTDRTLWPTGHYKTRGTFVYDWTNKRYRIDRDNGRYDRYCGTNGVYYQFHNTPCSHIVVDGNRYLYYPDENDCCYCCNAAQGCGILKNDWMSGATFEGTESYQLQNGATVDAYKWRKDGLQSNYYYETQAVNATDRVMLDITQTPNEETFFDDARYLYVNSASLELPPLCSLSKSCSTLSTCTLVSQGHEEFY